MTTQISQTGRIDLDVTDVGGPVINYPAVLNGGGHFVQVHITDHLSLLITTAAEAQELETRFAAARRYLSDEPEPYDDREDFYTALVPDVAQPADVPAPCGRCGSADHPMDPVTDSHAPGGVKNECHDLHDCTERAAQVTA